MLISVALVLALIYFILGLKRPGIALITVPIVCAVFLSWATLFLENDEDILQMILGIPLICVATVTSALLSRCQPGLERWPQKWAKWVLLGIAILLFIVTGFIVVQSNVPSLAFPSLLVFIAILMATAAMINYGLTSKQSNAAYVLSTIGASMRQNLPLPMALESAAAGRDDKQARILTNISRWLVRGCPIAESIAKGFPKCPSHALALITSAEQINQLPLAFQSIEADMAAKSEENKTIEPLDPAYPAVVMVILFGIASLIMTFIMPSFAAVFSEMSGGIELPAASQWLLGISHFIMYEYGWMVTILPVGLLIPFCSYVKFRRRNPHNPRLSSKIGDVAKWYLPILHALEKNFSMVQVTEMLRLSLNAGCTVNDAIDRTLDLDINNCLRKHINQWLKRVEAGENISEAAMQSRLPRPLAWAFDDKVNQGNTPTVLETLESMYRSKYNCETTNIRAVIHPCITLVLAAAVGFVVYAIHSMPVAMIYHTAESVYP